MTRKLHIGAGLWVLASACGRVGASDGDVALQQVDLTADLRPAEARTRTLSRELTQRSAAFTADQLLEWEPLLGEADDTEFGGRWEGNFTLGDVSVETFCVRADRGDDAAMTIRCKETGRRKGQLAYLADWEGRQAIGRARVCTFTERIRLLDVRDEAARGTIEADFKRRSSNEQSCAQRILGHHPLAYRAGDAVRIERHP